VAINYYLTRINEARGKSERAYINHLLSFNPIDCVANYETHERNGVEKKKKRCVRTTNVFDSTNENSTSKLRKITADYNRHHCPFLHTLQKSKSHLNQSQNDENNKIYS